MDNILARIQKLLRLAGRSTNEHEAAAAASRAAALMAAHQLSEAEVRLSDSERPPEPIVSAFRLDPEDDVKRRRKIVAWRGAVAGATAKALGCYMYWSRGDIRFFGRESAVQTAAYTTHYLCGEIERLAKEARRRVDLASWESPRAWGNAFRIGAAQAVAIRLIERAQSERSARKAATEEARRAAAVAETQGMVEAQTRTSQAMVLVERDQEEVEAAYAQHSRRFKTARVGGYSSSGGYGAGREAGRSVHLGGGRAALGAGAPALRGGGK